MTRLLIMPLMFFAPAFSYAIQCEVVNTYVTSDSGATYPWKAMTAMVDGEKFYSANMNDGSCSFSVSHAAANGDMYTVSIQDLEAGQAATGNAAFDEKGRLYFSLSNSRNSTVCMVKCFK